MNSVPWNVIKHKVGRLHLADEIGSVSRVCKLAVFSRNTCYYYQSAMAIGSVDALIDANRHQPNLCNRVDVITETLGDAKALREQLHVHSSIMCKRCLANTLEWSKTSSNQIGIDKPQRSGFSRKKITGKCSFACAIGSCNDDDFFQVLGQCS